MSEDWQVPEGLVESLLTTDPCADERYNGYLDGVQAGKEYIGRMMMDLIKELRDEDEIAGTDNRSCGACFGIFDAVHRAEKRLREVTGDA